MCFLSALGLSVSANQSLVKSHTRKTSASKCSSWHDSIFNCGSRITKCIFKLHIFNNNDLILMFCRSEENTGICRYV